MFRPAPSRSTRCRGAPQKSGPAGRTRKSDPRPTSHCLAPARGKWDGRLRRPSQRGALKPAPIRPQFLPRPRLRFYLVYRMRRTFEEVTKMTATAVPRLRFRGTVPLLNLRGAEIDSIESKDTIIKSKKGGRNHD